LKSPDEGGKHSTSHKVNRRKVALANAWKSLRVGVGHWDPRTEYRAVGKERNLDWDEVCDLTFSDGKQRADNIPTGLSHLVAQSSHQRVEIASA
jgi:hypothetical protein